VNRNHFGRQVESFQQNLPLPFLDSSADKDASRPYRCVFIRAPVVEKVLPSKPGIQVEEASREATVVAPSVSPIDEIAKEEVGRPVEVLAKLPSHFHETEEVARDEDIIAVRQGNVFGTSFHPELTEDPRIHVWWLENVLKAVERRRQNQTC
jgi:pyridoxal 5'-phosphate synthase pdxT subunit